MPPSPAALLKILVERKGEPQKAVALSWLERWRAAGGRPLSIATVGPRLSNALGDQIDGWQFYFGTPQRAAILFDVLDATEAERTALSLAAAERLAGHGAARTVVDLHDLPGDIAAMLLAAEQALFSNRLLLPASILVTADQYARLPMAYSDRQDELQLVKVADGDEAGDAICARPHALVLSALPPRDPDSGAAQVSRWCAIAWEDGKLLLDPSDGVDEFARTGSIPEFPTVDPAHRLDTLGIAPRAPSAALTGPALRRRLRSIADGSLDAPAAERLGEALAHGIVAASTDDERVRAMLAVGGLPEETRVDATSLARALGRAKVRPTPPAVLFCEGLWHLLNVQVPPPLADHPRVRTHAAAAGPTPLHRLAAAVSGRTATAWELDPLLHEAINTLDPGGAEHAAFAHARAWLVYGGHCAVSDDAPVADPMVRLARLVAHPAPAAQLRLTRVAAKDDRVRCFVLPLPAPERLERDVWTQVPPIGATIWQTREMRLTAARVVRTSTIKEAMRASPTPNLAERACFSDDVWEGEATLPAARPMDDDAWLDAYEARGPASPGQHLRHRHAREAAREALERREAFERELATRARHPKDDIVMQIPRRGFPQRRTDGRDDGDVVSRSAFQVRVLDGPDWAELDLAVALAWNTLRDALATRAPFRLHDGRWLLPLSPGLLAELTIVAAPESAEVRAGIGQQFVCGLEVAGRPGWRAWSLSSDPHIHDGCTISFSPMFGPVHAWEARTDSLGKITIGATTPLALHLVGEGLSCTVRFVADPYGVTTRSGGQPADLGQTAAGFVRALDEAAAQGGAADARRLADDD